MDSIRILPPRKNLTPTRISKQYLSPLQILLQMGFHRHRAEKALAATGHRSAQLAADWLLAHVNDPTLDSPSPREYIVYACPCGGDLLQQLELFWDKSFDECGWNEAHNYMPHMTLVSFFKAPDECSLQLAQTLEQVVKQELESSNASTAGFPFEKFVSPNFMGLTLSEENTNILKRIAVQYVKEVSNAIINDNYEQLDAIATCFPWCTNATSKFSFVPENTQVSIKPHVKSLHITLANEFEPTNFEKLKKLTENIKVNPNSQAFWEIRLYSRDSRVRGKQVFKVIYSYSPKESDELELRIGDFIYVSDDTNVNSSDVWVEGTSWLTGCTGFFPVNYTQRTAETDSWTLHISVPLFERDTDSELLDMEPQNTEDLCNTDLLTCDNASTVSLCSVPLADNEYAHRSNSQTVISPTDIYVMRHGERIDFCFGNWIPLCISEKGEYHREDLNMPMQLPKRHNFPQSFREDTPLTNVGVLEASLTGEALKSVSAQINYAFCSPALRCVQTCNGVLTGLGIADKLPIRIEPGLFEWLTWYQAEFPDWMTEEELIAAGYKIDTSYKPAINREKLKTHVKEDCHQYYDRHFHVMQYFLNLVGEQNGGNILVVGHASSLDTCSRQLCGKEPRNEENMNKIMIKVPYCSMVKVQKENNQWKVVDSTLPGISHSHNKRFDWKIINSDP